MTTAFRPELVAGVQVSVRAAAAAALALVAAQFLRLPFPIYAMIAAVIVLELSPAQTRQLALPRLAGTVVGATLGATISPLLQSRSGAIALGIASAMLLSHLLRLPAAAKLAGYVCGIVLLEHDAHPWSYAGYRLIETGLGVGAAVLVSLMPKLLRTDAPGGPVTRPAARSACRAPTAPAGGDPPRSSTGPVPIS